MLSRRPERSRGVASIWWRMFGEGRGTPLWLHVAHHAVCAPQRIITQGISELCLLDRHGL